jgi:PAS domain S-box-containing protein
LGGSKLVLNTPACFFSGCVAGDQEIPYSRFPGRHLLSRIPCTPTMLTTPDSTVMKAQDFARLTGLVAALAGVAVLAGWTFDLALLKSLLPGAATMKANTALAFAALGLALRRLDDGRQAGARALAGAAAVLAGLTLLEYLAGTNFGIDELFFADPGTDFPGRMAPATATALLLQAAALLLLSAGRIPAGQGCALAAGTLGLIGLLGYLIDTVALYAVLSFTAMAAHTAFLLAFLSVGTLCARPDAGIMREIAAPGVGGQAARRMLLAGLLVVLVAWLAHAGEHAGFYPYDFSLILTVVAALAMLVSVVWFSARSLNRDEARLRLADGVLRQMNEGITITDAAGTILDVNAGFARITGYAPEEVIGHNPRLLKSGMQGAAFYREMWQALKEHGRWHGEVINRRKSGELYAELLSISAIHDDAGRTTHYVGVFADLSERIEHERQRRQLADRLDIALQAGHIGTWHYDMEALRLSCDDELLHLHGLDAGQPIDTLAGLLARVHAEDRARVAQAFARCAGEGEPLDIEYRVLPADGEARVLAARGHARHDLAADAREAAGACWDITERRQSEYLIRNLNQSLEQRVAERTVQLEAAVKELEAFSYSVAHDLRGPLRGLDGFSQILMEDYGTRLDADAQGHLQRIRSASQRMGSLIDNLLELSRLMRADMEPVPVDLGRMAGEIAAELRREEPARNVDVTIAPGLVALADPTLARVILDNLLRNAWKYTAKTAEARIVFESQPARDGGTEFVVRDNGAGFDMRFAGKLFQPFQRLHHARDYAGTGVGLASVARAVQRHGGRIRAEGKVGQGATFWFTLETDGNHDGTP